MSARTPVPFLDLGPEFAELSEAWFEALRGIGASGRFVLGPNVEAFEREAAAYVGVGHAVGVANGTDALVLALRALGIGPGDEVITTPFTFFATAEAVSVVGATPVFADIDPVSFNLDPGSVAERIGPRTAAILVVHIFGHPADMEAFTALARRHGLALVEDCAQAFGAEWEGRRVGAFGDAAAVSFYPTKVLGCYGDGGMVFTPHAEVAERVRHIRNHGATAPFLHDTVGCNSRLDEVQAALLRLKLARIGEALAGRAEVAAAYAEGLADTDLVLPQPPARGRHAFNLYTVRSGERDALRAHLATSGIPTSQCYPLGLHLQDVYRHLGYREGDLPVTDRVCTETLSLPIYPAMGAERIARVCEAVRAFERR